MKIRYNQVVWGSTQLPAIYRGLLKKWKTKNSNLYKLLAIGTRSAFFFNESRRTKVPKPYYSREKACQVEHFETFRKAIGPVLGL